MLYVRLLYGVLYIIRTLDNTRVCVDMSNKTTEERFWEKVDKTNSCWIWTSEKNYSGYGKFQLKGKRVKAHRFSYELTNGKIPKGLTIDHLCRNRSCVNPDHLEAVTQKENLLRGISPAAINSRRKFCIRGHLLSGRNLYVKPNNGRQCRRLS